MNIPKFTAEASLYPRRARYQIRAMLAGFRPAGEIVPSLKVMQDCEYAIHHPWVTSVAACDWQERPLTSSNLGQSIGRRDR
jgi:hypothetical protein